MRVHPLQRLDHHVDHLLRGLLVGFHPGAVHVEAGGGIVAAERGAGRLRRAQVDADLGGAVLHRARHRRLGGHAGDDLALLHAGQKRVAGADRHQRVVLHLQSGLRGQRAGEEVGRRAEAGDAERLALPVGGVLQLVGVGGLHQHHFARRHRELHHRGDELAFGLQVDGVIVEPDHALHLARQQRGRGLRAGGRVEQFDVEALLLEEAELGGELRRQIDLLVDAADHDLDRGLRLRKRGGKRESRNRGNSSDGENFAHGVFLAGFQHFVDVFRRPRFPSGGRVATAETRP